MYSQDPVRRPLNTIDLLVNALNQDPGRPLPHLPDGRTATVGEVHDATSQYVQALTSLGVVEGTRVALLSHNLPDGSPKSMATRRGSSAALWSVMLAEWEWPRPPRVLSCVPLSHAGDRLG
ncbi:FeoA domain-containing protein [Streptomyces sp. NPDC059455]|uniref:FeoA domain-containing protein n=1 Tax=Streptomyces sp. NPDC059455 TaxID=3346837 RepID=UPI00367D8F23